MCYYTFQSQPSTVDSAPGRQILRDVNVLLKGYVVAVFGASPASNESIAPNRERAIQNIIDGRLLIIMKQIIIYLGRM
jgi:hypothetical protein